MGICVRCGTLVCVECATQVDGINHCVACLQAAVPEPVAVVAERARPGLGRLAVVVLGLAAALWSIFEATLPG